MNNCMVTKGMGTDTGGLGVHVWWTLEGCAAQYMYYAKHKDGIVTQGGRVLSIVLSLKHITDNGGWWWIMATSLGDH